MVKHFTMAGQEKQKGHGAGFPDLPMAAMPYLISFRTSGAAGRSV